ncbi:MAG: CocE/NonD family hydrolase [Pseudomonadota bacterium]
MNGKPFHLSFGHFVEMPDGVCLHAAIYKNAEVDKAPALLTLTPYTVGYVHNMASKLASAGFAVVVVDVRGRGDSGGVFDLYNDGKDGAACVDWVAAQPWCNGDVALFGGSYAGLNQWAIAAQKPAALKAIAPICAPMPGLDADGFNGLFPMNNLRWASFIRGRTLHRQLLEDEAFWKATYLDLYRKGATIEDLRSALDGDDNVLAAIIEKFDKAGAWDAAVHGPQGLQAIKVPALTMTGTADNAQRGAIAYHERSKSSAPRWLVVGPWNHAGQRDPNPRPGAPETPPSRVIDDTEFETLVGFFKWALFGAALPSVLSASEAIYVDGLETWIDLNALPERSAKLFYPGNKSQLLDHRPEMQVSFDLLQPSSKLSHGEQEIARDSADLFDILGGEKSDDAWHMSAQDEAGFVCLSAPLESDIVFLGRPSATLTVTTTVPEVAIYVLIFVQAPNGDSRIISSDARALKTVPGSANTVAFDTFRFGSSLIGIGSRIGVKIALVDSPAFASLPAMQPQGHQETRVSFGEDDLQSVELPLFKPDEVARAKII